MFDEEAGTTAPDSPAEAAKRLAAGNPAALGKVFGIDIPADVTVVEFDADSSLRNLGFDPAAFRGLLGR
ncbi:MAG TPA: hypothetical protein VN408_03035 [Actinoplanes sp.]|nr:hypothetical protein [Actinoplanes sp.]